MTLTLSCAFATSMATPDHVARAESLGYERAWLYDSPALYPDVWVTLARCAERTSTIGIGPGVLIPSLRHPMANASAIATLVELAGPGRVAVAVGSGFTGRLTLGQRPLPWRFVAAYVRALRGLLQGEVVEWEGAKMRMLHPEGYGAARPVDVPILVAAAGPKGVATARELGDGAFIAAAEPVPGFDWSPFLFFGTVLGEGEDATSERVMASAGHAAAVYYHFWYEAGRPMSDLPNGPEWEKGYTDVPRDVRHLAMHDQHLIAVNQRDQRFLSADLVAQLGMALQPAELRDRLAQLEAGGMTEVAYQPAGPDIPRELEAFAAAVRG
jgi:5,10-methylenetetrahydromethanopterin reductase